MIKGILIRAVVSELEKSPTDVIRAAYWCIKSLNEKEDHHEGEADDSDRFLGRERRSL